MCTSFQLGTGLSHFNCVKFVNYFVFISGFVYICELYECYLCNYVSLVEYGCDSYR